MTQEYTGLTTVQFAWGGLCDGLPAAAPIHLAPCIKPFGTGKILCGIDRFDKAGPGFSIGGGISDPNAYPCIKCCEAARRDCIDQPVEGMFGELFDVYFKEAQEREDRAAALGGMLQ